MASIFVYVCTLQTAASLQTVR